MKKLIYVIIFISQILNAAVVIQEPKELESIVVNVSNKSTNRIIFPNKIERVIDSKEKNLMIEVVGNEAYIKYVPFQEEVFSQVANAKEQVSGETKIIYDKAVIAEIHVVTKNRTYTLSLRPKNMDEQTIYINSDMANHEKSLKYETKNDYTSTLSNIAVDVLNNRVPQGYKSEDINKIISNSNEIEVKLLSINRGTLYNAYYFEINNKTSEYYELKYKELLKYSPFKPKSIAIYYNNETNTLLPKQSSYCVIITEGN